MMCLRTEESVSASHKSSQRERHFMCLKTESSVSASHKSSERDRHRNVTETESSVSASHKSSARERNFWSDDASTNRQDFLCAHKGESERMVRANKCCFGEVQSSSNSGKSKFTIVQLHRRAATAMSPMCLKSYNAGASWGHWCWLCASFGRPRRPPSGFWGGLRGKEIVNCIKNERNTGGMGWSEK